MEPLFVDELLEEGSSGVTISKSDVEEYIMSMDDPDDEVDFIEDDDVIYEDDDNINDTEEPDEEDSEEEEENDEEMDFIGSVPYTADDFDRARRYDAVSRPFYN